MSKDKGEDKVEEDAGRLGDRFSGTGSTSKTDDREADNEENTEEKPAEQEKESVEWVPATLYMPEEQRKEFRRFLKRVSLDFPEIEDADKRELHTAAIRAAMENPEKVAEHAEEITDS